MRTFFSHFALLAILTLGLVACEKRDPEPSVMPETITVVKDPDFSKTKTIGNHSYLPINRVGSPDDMIFDILAVLAAFEKSHPDIKVTGWAIEKQQQARDTIPRVFGLWINHEPVEVKPKEK